MEMSDCNKQDYLSIPYCNGKQEYVIEMQMLWKPLVPPKLLTKVAHK